MYECLEEKYRQRLRWILTPCTGVCMYVFLCLWECVHMCEYLRELPTVPVKRLSPKMLSYTTSTPHNQILVSLLHRLRQTMATLHHIPSLAV